MKRPIGIAITATLLVGCAAGPATAQKVPALAVTVTPDVPYGPHRLHTLDVYAPATAGPHAAVVVVHGGQWVRGDKSDAADLLATKEFLARLDMVGFAINYRLASDPRVKTGTVGGDPYPAPVQDVQRAVQWIRDHAWEWGVDPARLGLMGISAGGHLALQAGSTLTDVDAVVSWSGPTNLPSLVKAVPSVGPEVESFLGCSLRDPACQARAGDASPLSHVSSGDEPTFLANSLDEDIPEQQAIGFGKALTAAAVPNQVDLAPGTAHGWNLYSAAGSETGAFLRSYLAEAPDGST
jgi:acetyl esterase/lipase